jgi:HAD superfamily hydrolase (TIGR01509 family)
MIKAILFDMDGVLIDAREWHYEALNRALRHFGYSISEESHLSTFDGLPTRDKLHILSSARGLPVGLHHIINALKQAYTLEISHQRCKPTFNHRFALSRLKKDGYKLAVCSNSVRQTIKAMMSLSALSPHLDLLISNQDVTNGKPNQEMYLRAMAELDVKPHECLILEDNEHGIKAAIASGGHLLRIGLPDDVSYHTIKRRIDEIEAV